MRISLSPQRRDDTITVSKAGDVITINGEAFDFSSLPDGGTIDAGDIPCEWITDTVERVGDDLHLTLLMPHGPNPSPLIAYPMPLIVTTDGPVAIPGQTVEPA